MYDFHIQEMAEKIVLSLPPEARPTIKSVRTALSEYWEDKAAIVWTVDDVLSESACGDMGLTRDQAIEVLRDTAADHDATVGITWESFRETAEFRFPLASGEGNENPL